MERMGESGHAKIAGNHKKKQKRSSVHKIMQRKEKKKKIKSSEERGIHKGMKDIGKNTENRTEKMEIKRMMRVEGGKNRREGITARCMRKV